MCFPVVDHFEPKDTTLVHERGPRKAVSHILSPPKTYSGLGFFFYRITEPLLTLGFYYMFNKGTDILIKNIDSLPQDLISDSQPDSISYLSWETMKATMGTCVVWTRNLDLSAWILRNGFPAVNFVQVL
jgi:hypothetical protein